MSNPFDSGSLDRDVDVESLARLIPFVLRQRVALVASIVLSIGAALFSVAQLSLIYPSMKLLLEGKTFSQHVDVELQSANEAVTRESNYLLEIDRKLNDPAWMAENTQQVKASVQMGS